MVVKRIEEPKELVELNKTIRQYGGMYANWKSSGCKGKIPVSLIEQLTQVHVELDVFLTHFEEGKG